MNSSAPLEELDLAIVNMDLPDTEKRALLVLKGLPGVHGVRLIERGCWLQYDAARVTKERICQLLESAGLTVEVFQDSKSGETSEVDF